MGTAFVLLVILMAGIVLMGYITGFLVRRSERASASEPGSEGRDKAMAAAIAVGAVMERRRGGVEAEGER